MAASPTFCIITPNPALDHILLAPSLRIGTIQRVPQTHLAAGGKGLNVARVARALGMNVTVCAPLGGFTGQHVATLARREGIVLTAVPIDGETRICTLIVDPTTDTITVLNEQGPSLTDHHWQAFIDRILDVQATWNLICGSLPPEIAPTVLTDLIGELHRQNRYVLVDTSGPALAAAMAVKPDVVKINGDEAGELLGMSVTSIATAQQAASELVRRGIDTAVITLGAQGAVGIGRRHGPAGVIAMPPPITARSPIGCGDSFFAGLAMALADDRSLAEALRIATACGVADAQTIEPGRIDPQIINTLAQQIAISYW
ncbi:MAG: 1-phosphofructokinase [Chloroflexus sp.]|nr:MAG: 1-phosphofructokinase [Chloroflexus sp.]